MILQITVMLNITFLRKMEKLLRNLIRQELYSKTGMIGKEFAKSYGTVCDRFRITGYFLAPDRRFVVTDTYYQDNFTAKKVTAPPEPEEVAITVPAEAPVAKKAFVKKAAPVFNLYDSDDSVAASTNSKKRPSPRSRSDSDASEDYFDIGTFEPAVLTPAPKQIRTTKGKSKVVMKPINLNDSEDDNIEEEKQKPKKKTVSKKVSTKAKAKAKPKPEKKKEEVFDEDDLSEDEEDYDGDMVEESDGDASFVPPPRARKITYHSILFERPRS